MEKETIKQSDNNPPWRWDEAECPSQKMLRLGEHALSDAQMLYIILFSGSSRARQTKADKRTAELCEKVIKEFGNLRHLFRAASLGWKKSGLSDSQIAKLMTISAVMRRIGIQKNDVKRIQFTDTTVSGNYLSECLQGLATERFLALYLDKQHYLLENLVVDDGDVSSARVSVRRIVSRALELHASVVLIAHNHPSGSRKPSTADMRVTEDLKAALKPFGIRLLDHFIIADGAEPFSLSENGLFDNDCY